MVLNLVIILGAIDMDITTRKRGPYWYADTEHFQGYGPFESEEQALIMTQEMAQQDGF